MLIYHLVDIIYLINKPSILHTLRFPTKTMTLESPKIMGILNITPDSFYDGGQYQDQKSIFARIEAMISEGVDIIDIGAMSSKPYSKVLTSDEEISRLIPVLGEIRKAFPSQIISVDTIYAHTAKKALDIGVDMINDISGGNLDSDMFATIAEYNVPYVLMHMQGDPSQMQDSPSYDNVTLDVLTFCNEKIKALRELGVHDIIIDPGFGFGKSIEQNYELLKKLGVFSIPAVPVLVGLSRKSMIWKPLHITPDGALYGTMALHMIALQNGANILRVHDVREAKQVIQLFDLVQG